LGTPQEDLCSLALIAEVEPHDTDQDNRFLLRKAEHLAANPKIVSLCPH
jgi:hypothetical protein